MGILDRNHAWNLQTFGKVAVARHFVLPDDHKDVKARGDVPATWPETGRDQRNRQPASRGSAIRADALGHEEGDVGARFGNGLRDGASEPGVVVALDEQPRNDGKAVKPAWLAAVVDFFPETGQTSIAAPCALPCYR